MKNPVKRHKKQMRLETTPVDIPRTVRTERIQVGTTLKPGKVIPLKAFPLYREDALVNCPVTFSFEQMETAEILMNAVQVQVKAYFVPFLAMERFNGREHFDHSYKGLPFMDETEPTSFIETEAFGDPETREFYKYLGVHGKATDQVNTMYLESYNQIVNFQRTNISPELEQRARLDASLATALWGYNKFKHIVPDYDQAKIDGEVALSVSGAKMPVKGLGLWGGSQTFDQTNLSVHEGNGVDTTYAKARLIGTTGAQYYTALKEDPDNPGYHDVYAELEGNGITVSLANIDLARQTRAWAKMRERFNGHEEHLIEMFMDGLTVPDKFWEQPILIGKAGTVFGQSKRYASDGANLTQSVVDGATYVNMRVNVPRCPVGGVVMFTAEITPEQLFERQKDSFLHMQNAEEFPEAMADYLDPEKVVRVSNDYIDVDHDNPDDFFGYAPLNHEHMRNLVNMGGDFYRPQVDAAFDEKRQRFWAVETQNPTLGNDFYLASAMHEKPFAQTTFDNFECVGRGQAVISGLTQFGNILPEATDDYQKVIDQVETETIDKDAAEAPAT